MFASVARLVGFAMVVGCAPRIAAQAENALRWGAGFGVNGFISTSAPAVGPDRSIIVGVETRFGGRVIAISPNGDRERWVFDRGSQGYFSSSPAIREEANGYTVYIGCGDGRLYALNGLDGRERWSVRLGPFIDSSPAIGPDGTIYVGAGDFGLHAVAPDGRVRWRFGASSWIDSSPAIAPDGTIYVGSDDRHVYAVTPEGNERWRFLTGGPIFSSPALAADGTVYVGSDDQNLYAIAPDGTEKWRFPTNGSIQASPVTGADGTIYFASNDSHFYAVTPEGALRWRVETRTSSISTAAVRGDGVIIVGGDDGVVRAFNPGGDSRWIFDTRPAAGDYIESSPVVAEDGTIYIGSLDGRVYALNGNGSPLSQYASWPAFRRNARHTAQGMATNSGGVLVNLSTRAEAGGAANFIAGFAFQGVSEKAYLIRAVGPALGALVPGFNGFLPDPRLDIFSGVNPSGYSNDNWHEQPVPGAVVDAGAALGAFPLPAASKDAALVAALAPGTYTAHVGSTDGRAGVALVEIYDAIAGDPNARLINLSTRGNVGTDDNVLIAGLVVGGTGRIRLLLRGIGPGLRGFGVTGALEQPRLTLFSRQLELATNTGWASRGLKHDLAVAAARVSAFPLADGSADCAIIFDAAPGDYTLQIAGVNRTTGEALVEIYVLP